MPTLLLMWPLLLVGRGSEAPGFASSIAESPASAVSTCIGLRMSICSLSSSRCSCWMSLAECGRSCITHCKRSASC